MRRGTAAFPLGAVVVAATAALGVTVGARLDEERSVELRPPVRSAAAVPVARNVDPFVAGERVEQSRSDLVRSEEAPAERVEERVARTLRVVRGDDRSPFAGAEVVVDDGSRERECAEVRRTDERGELELVVANCVGVEVRAPGFADERLLVDRESSDGGVTVELHRTCVVTGRVVAADGTPVGDAEIFALGRFRRTVGRERVEGGQRRTSDRTDLGESDAEGRFGPVECCAFAVTAFEVKDGERRCVVPRIARDGSCGGRVDVELRLPPPVELVVRVVDATGRPADAATLDATWTRQFDLFSELHGWCSFDDQGCASIPLVAAGRYRVEVSDPDHCDEGGEAACIAVEAQLHRGSNELTIVVPWAVAAADEPEPAEGSLRGTVTCDCRDDERCGSLRVALWCNGEEVAGSECFVHDDFLFLDVPVGVYRVVVGGERHLTVASGSFLVGPDVEVEVAPLHATTVAHRSEDSDEHEDEEAPLDPPSGSVRGAITCRRCGTEGSKFRVKLVREESDVRVVAPPAEGAYAFDEIEAGRWSVVVSGAGHRRVAAAWFDVSVGEAVEVPPLELEELEPVTGCLHDEEGRPLGSIELEMVGTVDPDHERVHGRSDESGCFRMPRIEGGCVLDVVDPAIGEFRFDVPPEPRRDWILTLPRPRRIAGRVVVPLGVPLELLFVSCSGPFDRTIGRIQVAPDGRFEFARATARDCELTLCLDRWLDGTYAIARREIAAGGDVDVGVWELPAPR